MEILACGAFMRTQRTDEHVCLFKEGKEEAYLGSNENFWREYATIWSTKKEGLSLLLEERGPWTVDSSHHERLEDMLSTVEGEKT